jgi:DDE superfamily endonuclease
MLRLGEWLPEYLVFIDETAVNERALDRRYGWSALGTPAQMIQSVKRTKKWSVLPMYSMDGFITWEIVHGSFDAALFEGFLHSHVIPNMQQYPGPRSVLVMDNAAIHRTTVCSTVGCN